jgi:hypothetical protein
LVSDGAKYRQTLRGDVESVALQGFRIVDRHEMEVRQIWTESNI